MASPADTAGSGPRADADHVNRILAVHSGALGDVILFGHLLRRLQGHVTVICGGDRHVLLRGLGVSDQGAAFEGLPMHEVFMETPTRACRLSEVLGGFDLLVSCFATGDPSAQQRLTEFSGASRSFYLPIRPEKRDPRHLLEVWACMMGLPPDTGAQTAWRVPSDWCDLARGTDDAGRMLPDVATVIHPGSGGKAKCWPLDRFVEVARRLAGDVVFALGPAECERWPRGTVADLEEEFSVLRMPSLPRLAGLLHRAPAYVGNDSGPSHLAAAVGTPTVAIFGPTDPGQFAPVGPRVSALAKPLLASISVDEVCHAVADLTMQAHRNRA
jgi:glycosyl transferase family 9 (putative heptosyltransferase)